MILTATEPAFCWDDRYAFTIFGVGVGQQMVIGMAIIIAVLIFTVWRFMTHNHKYHAWGDSST